MTDVKKGQKKKCAIFRLYYKNLEKNFFLKSHNPSKMREKNQKYFLTMVVAHGNPVFLYF